MCNYIIHGEFELLQNDKYFVKCMLTNKENQTILYNQTVKRASLN
jgi:hypothetical protein